MSSVKSLSKCLLTLLELGSRTLSRAVSNITEGKQEEAEYSIPSLRRCGQVL
jgi:hypothetical protein